MDPEEPHGPSPKEVRESPKSADTAWAPWIVRKPWRAVNGPILIASDPVTPCFLGQSFCRWITGKKPISEFQLAWLDPDDRHTINPLGGFQFMTRIPLEWLGESERNQAELERLPDPVEFDTAGNPYMDENEKAPRVVLPETHPLRRLFFRRDGHRITVHREFFLGTSTKEIARLDDPDPAIEPWELPPFWVNKVIGHSVDEVFLAFVIEDDRAWKKWIRNNPATLDGPLTESVAYHRNLLLTHAWDNYQRTPDLYSRQNGRWHMYKLRN